MTSRPVGVCPTGKRRFRDRVAALLALAEIARADGERREEVRAYRCPECRGWHLTSKAVYERPKLSRWDPDRKRKYVPPRLRPERSRKRRDDE